uniref:PPUP8436 n=1 Tax=Poeciliopsis prolifica TaxID=188132 RepID=A0A0S7EKN5_9TELE
MTSYEEVSQESMEADSMSLVEGTPGAQEKQEINSEENETKSDIQKLFEGSESILSKITVVSDYKQIPTIRAENGELLRLLSADSGMESYEEASQESMEEDSIYMTEGHDDGSLSKESEIQKLFGGSRGIFCQNPPQGFSGYKQVPTIQAESPELPRASCLDSGINKVN